MLTRRWRSLGIKGQLALKINSGFQLLRGRRRNSEIFRVQISFLGCKWTCVCVCVCINMCLFLYMLSKRVDSVP